MLEQGSKSFSKQEVLMPIVEQHFPFVIKKMRMITVISLTLILQNFF